MLITDGPKQLLCFRKGYSLNGSHTVLTDVNLYDLYTLVSDAAGMMSYV